MFCFQDTLQYFHSTSRAVHSVLFDWKGLPPYPSDSVSPAKHPVVEFLLPVDGSVALEKDGCINSELPRFPKKPVNYWFGP